METVIIVFLAWVFFGYLAKGVSLAAWRTGFSSAFNASYEKKDKRASWVVAVFGPLGLIAAYISWLIIKCILSKENK